jgi:hypothetical protein
MLHSGKYLLQKKNYLLHSGKYLQQIKNYLLHSGKYLQQKIFQSVIMEKFKAKALQRTD